MQTLPTKTTDGLEVPFVNKKSLVLDGYKAIETHTCYQSIAGTLFLEENVLLFVTEGAINIRHGNESYVVGTNEMAFLKKDILIEYESSNGQLYDQPKIEFIVVTLKYDLVKEFIKMAEISVIPKSEAPCVTVNSAGQQLSKYIDSLQLFFIQPELIGCSLVKIKLFELLFYLAGIGNQILEQLVDLREHYRSNITSTVEENIMNSLSLNQLAVLAGRSLSSFRRDFLAIYNMPPSQWIRKKRLEKAQELLSSTNMTVTDICYTLGFESVAHFSRLFKSHFGHPPSEFRMNSLVA
ncbi:helix-turn-helix domain-containing protein [Lacibacter sediminis]|uniref:Helix-turn-helix transcriptional regulator n=1 Tax=Lacibacter sediminis TaxID=2760713 RepID=A0A7G5XK70_9BACT|nr:AraC family transcriptional regulator [Lacibacter sediminis]QNA45873.1 helix-turn-helix transcriptional regulator [Lacibacter sediminis]